MGDVNTLDQLTQDVNIRLGKHIKIILLYLYKQKESLQRQNWIIKNAYKLYRLRQITSGPNEGKFMKVWPSTLPRKLRVSACRAFKTLETQGLIYRHHYKYKYEYKGRPLYTNYRTGEQVRAEKKPTKTWNSKPWFGITELGIEFVNNSIQLNRDVNNKEVQ